MNEPWFGLEWAWVPGPLLGVFGAAFGVLGGVLVPQGRGRAVVLAVGWAAAVYGGGLLVAGLTALAVGQPYHVWYSLTLTGCIGTFLDVPLVLTAAALYRKHEGQRMAAQDFG